MKPSPAQRILALLLAAQLALPGPAAALRPEPPTEANSAVVSGLEESLIAGQGREDITAEILATHPFIVEAWGGPEKDRQRLFLWSPKETLGTPSFGAVGSQAKKLMEQDGLSFGHLMGIIGQSLPISDREFISRATIHSDEVFDGWILGHLKQYYQGRPEVAFATIRKLAQVSNSRLVRILGNPDKPIREQQLQQLGRENFGGSFESAASREQLALLIRLRLVYRLKEYLRDSYSISPVDVFQAALLALVSPGYEPLINHVNRVLTNPHHNPRMKERGRPISSVEEIERLELWSMKEGDVTAVIRVEIALKGRPERVRFALNVAKDPLASTEEVKGTYALLMSYYRQDPDRVMEPYGLSLIRVPFETSGGIKYREVAVLVSEWVEGQELHLYADSNPPWLFHVWWEQQIQRAALSEEASRSVWEQYISMNAAYARFSRQGPLDEDLAVYLPIIRPNGGDLVYHRKPDGTWAALLVWPRSEGPPKLSRPATMVARGMLAPIPDNSSGSLEVIWWDEPERALQIVMSELEKKFRYEATVLELHGTEADAWVRRNVRRLAQEAFDDIFPIGRQHPERYFSQWDKMDATQRAKTSQVIRHADQALKQYLEATAGLEEADAAGPLEPEHHSFQDVPALHRTLRMTYGILPPHDPSSTQFIRFIQHNPQRFRGKRVLEIGCGAGPITIALARAGAFVTAVDIVPEAVEDTRANLEEEPPEVRSRVVALGESDVYSRLSELTGEARPIFDVIVSAHPLMKRGQIPGEIASYAVHAGSVFEMPNKILAGLPAYLKTDGSYYSIVPKKSHLDEFTWTEGWLRLLLSPGYRAAPMDADAFPAGESAIFDDDVAIFEVTSATGLEETAPLSTRETQWILHGPYRRLDGGPLRIGDEVDFSKRIFGIGAHADPSEPQVVDPSLFKGKRVLVIPGYGTLPFLLKAAGAREVVGMDNDPVVIAWQRARVLFGKHEWVADSLKYGHDAQLPYHGASKSPDPLLAKLVQEPPRDRGEFPSDLRLEGIRFEQADLLGELPAEFGAFDLVVVPYLFAVPGGIQGEGSYFNALRELLRVAGKTGTVLIGPIGHPEAQPLWEPMERYDALARWLVSKKKWLEARLSEPTTFVDMISVPGMGFQASITPISAHYALLKAKPNAFELLGIAEPNETGLEEAAPEPAWKIPDWERRLERALPLLEAKGWLAAQGLIGPLRNIGQNNERRLNDSSLPVHTRVQLANRLVILEKLAFLFEALAPANPSQSSARIVHYYPYHRPGPLALLELKTPDGPVRASIRFDESSPRLILQFWVPVSKNRWWKIGGARIGKDYGVSRDKPLLHMDLFDGKDRTIRGHVNVVPAWKLPGKEPPLDAFIRFRDSLQKYVRHLPRWTAPAGLEEGWGRRIVEAAGRWQEQGWFRSGAEFAQPFLTLSSETKDRPRRRELLEAAALLFEALSAGPETSPARWVAFRYGGANNRASLRFPLGENACLAKLFFRNNPHAPLIVMDFILSGPNGEPVPLGRIRMGADRRSDPGVPLLHLDAADPGKSGGSRRGPPWGHHLSLLRAFTPFPTPEPALTSFLAFQQKLLEKVRSLPKTQPAAPAGLEEADWKKNPEAVAAEMLSAAIAKGIKRKGILYLTSRKASQLLDGIVSRARFRDHPGFVAGINRAFRAAFNGEPAQLNGSIKLQLLSAAGELKGQGVTGIELKKGKRMTNAAIDADAAAGRLLKALLSDKRARWNRVVTLSYQKASDLLEQNPTRKTFQNASFVAGLNRFLDEAFSDSPPNPRGSAAYVRWRDAQSMKARGMTLLQIKRGRQFSEIRYDPADVAGRILNRLLRARLPKGGLALSFTKASALLRGKPSPHAFSRNQKLVAEINVAFAAAFNGPEPTDPVNLEARRRWRDAQRMKERRELTSVQLRPDRGYDSAELAGRLLKAYLEKGTKKGAVELYLLTASQLLEGAPSVTWLSTDRALVRLVNMELQSAFSSLPPDRAQNPQSFELWKTAQQLKANGVAGLRLKPRQRYEAGEISSRLLETVSKNGVRPGFLSLSQNGTSALLNQKPTPVGLKWNGRIPWINAALRRAFREQPPDQAKDREGYLRWETARGLRQRGVTGIRIAKGRSHVEPAGLEELAGLSAPELERFFLEELAKPEDERRVLPVYVKQLALRHQEGQPPHHTGALVSVGRDGELVGVLPMQNYVDDPDMRIRVSAKIHRLEHHRQDERPIHVIVEKKGRAYQPGRVLDFVFKASPRLTQGNFRVHPLVGAEWPEGPAPATGLEEFGEWSNERAEELWGQLETGTDERINERLGKKPLLLFSMHDYRQVLFSIFEEMAQDPAGSQQFIKGLVSELGSPYETPFWQRLEKEGRPLIPEPNSLQSATAAFRAATTLRNRWAIAAAEIMASWEILRPTLVDPAIRLSVEEWERWLRELLQELRRADEKLYELVQWDLRHRFPGKDGLILLHGSDTDHFKPGATAHVEDGFALTWSTNELRSYAGNQLAVVRVPFERIRISWLTQSEDRVLITEGAVQVLAVAAGDDLYRLGIPYDTGDSPNPKYWAYTKQELPAWVKQFAGLEEKSSAVKRDLARAELLQLFPSLPASVGLQALVFRDPETFDLVPLAVRWGWAVAVDYDGPESNALEQLLAQLPSPKGAYAVGTVAAARFLREYAQQVPVTDRRKGLELLGLRWDELPPTVSQTLEAIREFLGIAIQA